jgi:hypothetical protein
MVGPAIAFIVSEFLLEMYYLLSARKRLGVGIAELIDWKNILRVVGSCLVALPVIVAFQAYGSGVLAMIAASACYLALVLFIAFRLGVSDVGKIVGFVMAQLRRVKSA